MTRPQPEALATFQSQRSTQRRNAVLNAIRQLDRAAHPVTVAGVAALAGVDRSYIYDHPDLLEQIRQQRDTTPVKLAPRPVAERSTLASLQARLTSAHEEIARLKAENRKLRDRLAVTLGDAWQADLTDTLPTPRAAEATSLPERGGV
jgi:Family of unknown function (DUF6262)